MTVVSILLRAIAAVDFEGQTERTMWCQVGSGYEGMGNVGSLWWRRL